MIYVVLNLVMAVFFIGLSFYIDRQGKDVANNPLVPMSVYLSLANLFMAAALWANLNYMERLPLLSLRLSLIFMSAYSIDFCLYCILFPSYKRPKFFQAAKYILLLFCIWLCFSKITDVTITDFLGLKIDSQPLFTGVFSNYFPVSWYDLHKFLMTVFFPALSVLIMILRAENKNDRLNLQKSFVNALALVCTWLAIFAISLAYSRVKMFSTLSVFALCVGMVVLVYNSGQNFLYDFKYVLGVFITFIVCYAVPAFMVAFAFPFLWPMFAVNPVKFIFIMLLIIFACITVSYQISKFLSKKQYFRSFQYADIFEQQLSVIDYSGEPEETVQTMRNIFVHNLGLSEFHILVENEGNLEPIFEKQDENSIQKKLEVPVTFFDSLMNQNRTIIFKSAVENSHTFESDKKELLKFFKETESEAVILLAEGRRLTGALLLGGKAGGNIYNDYDFNTFTKLYSYFFVFGYYMKNIANKSIVGTINREIKMSSQIIASIQENMDYVKKPKYDIGTLMEHAHTIGGEFIDLIRLSDTKHIFVMGDLSGKGIAASMGMVIIKSIIRTFLQETKDFKLLVEKINGFIRFNLPKGTFFEGVFCLLDFNDDTLYYINCGVPSLFLYTRSYNNVIEIQGEGRVLGFARDIGKYLKVKKIRLNPGDVIVTCTDGLIDSKSLRGEVYGKERIQKSITDSITYPANSVARTVYQTAETFLSKEFDDDVSILVIKRLAK